MIHKKKEKKPVRISMMKAVTSENLGDLADLSLLKSKDSSLLEGDLERCILDDEEFVSFFRHIKKKLKKNKIYSTLDRKETWTPCYIQLDSRSLIIFSQKPKDKRATEDMVEKISLSTVL